MYYLTTFSMEIAAIHCCISYEMSSDVFTREDDGTLQMHVKPGSKLNNLLPLAMKKFASSDCRKIIWHSLCGATSKTVAFVERFKQTVFASIETEEKKVGEREQIHDLYQSTKIYYKQRECSLPEANARYVMDEATVSVLISKDPIPELDDIQHLSAARPETTLIGGLIPSTNLPYKPPSRRRLEHLRKRKRDRPLETESRESKVTKADEPIEDPLETVRLPVVEHESHRLAPGSVAVQRAFSKKNFQRKQKHKSRRT
ncbi:unnamed protein product [Calicophoron daubneyi]|uniref:DNA/RNA-binding protein Alba-like domain-containing protein n=1 Tax=Calicophoron daubneyi TaxID=300641 RepID=A0AAV2TWZ9_CALDB